MAAPASLFAHRDEPVERARHRATHEQQVALGIDPHHTEAELRKAPGPHVPGHPLSFDDARRVGSRSDRSGLAVPRVAVGLGAAAEVMAVHHALEAAALGDAGDLHAVALREDRHRHVLARLRGPPPPPPSPSVTSTKLRSTSGAVSRPAFFTWPARALAVRFGFRPPNPSSTRVPATCTTGHGPASIPVA